MTIASKSSAGSASMSRAAVCEVLMVAFPVTSVHAVKREGAAGQHAALSRGRGALDALAHHVGSAREEAVLMRIIGRPHDLVRPDLVAHDADPPLPRPHPHPPIHTP